MLYNTAHSETQIASNFVYFQYDLYHGRIKPKTKFICLKFSHQIEKSSVITIHVKRHFIVHPINLTNSTYSCREKAYLGTSIVLIYSISVYCCTYVILLALLARVWLCRNLASCLILLWTTGSILLWNQRNHICSTFSYNQYIQL